MNLANVKLIFTSSLLCLVSNLASADDAPSTQPCFPYLTQLPITSLMLAPSPQEKPSHKTYMLPATPATTQWGWFNNQQTPVLHIQSGDTVSIETMAASDNQVVPGTPIEEVVKMNNAIPGRGPHTVTGPIYVDGAEPGDILEIHFNKIIPRSYASNNNVPGKGLFPEEFPSGQIKYFYLDVEHMRMQFSPGIVVPLAPFPGVIAVAQANPGKFDTVPPGPFGGNMDLRVLTEGTTLYLPVFVKGALVWTGDSHAGQGNGEINLTAIETAFQELNITVNVIKTQHPLSWPRVETADSWVTVGYDKDLNKAFDILREETLKLIKEKRQVSDSEAQKIMESTWNCPISEVVNGINGVYCLTPKEEDVSAFPLPTIDTDKQYVTIGEDDSIEKAMKIASMAMLNRISAEKHLTRLDTYSLLSLTMDCRVAPFKQGKKTVHCMLDKNLWV